MLKSIIIAFSTYSRIPMPKIKWDENAMRYSLCFFPWVGMVIGGCSAAGLYGMEALGIGKTLAAAVLTLLPVLISGGIHMDGYLDTVDAKSSYLSRDERLLILKDPHAGAFAIIYAVVYFLLQFGLFHEVTVKEAGFIFIGYVYSRVLSALSVVTFCKAKKDGMAAAYADAAQKSVKWLLASELLLCIAAMLLLHPLEGIVCSIVGILCLLYYRNMAYQMFGGITGDLAGWFLQVCELLFLASVVIMGKVLRVS